MGGTADRLIWVTVVLAEIALLRSIHLRSRVVPALRPLFPLITFALVNDLVTRGLEEALDLAPKVAKHPFKGVYRALYHAHDAVQTAWPFAVAGLALWIFLPARRKLTVDVLLGTWIGLACGMVVVYPMTSVAIARMNLGVELAVVAITAGCAFWTWSRTRWGGIHTATLLLAGGEMVIAIVGPYATDPFNSWEVARAIYFCEFVGVAIWLGRLPAFR